MDKLFDLIERDLKRVREIRAGNVEEITAIKRKYSYLLSRLGEVNLNAKQDKIIRNLLEQFISLLSRHEKHLLRKGC